MAVTIRPATTADGEAMLALLPRLAEFNLPPSRNPVHLWEGDAALLRRWLEGDTGEVQVLVADAGGTIAGLSMVSLKPELLSHAPSAHLEAIAVAAGFEGQGLGRRLLEAAERDAAGAGAESMTLHVFATNSRARGLYESAGYDGELMRYIKPLDTSGHDS